MEKNEIIELLIDDMLDDGRAFGRYEGCAVFVNSGCRPESAKSDSANAVRSGSPNGNVILSETKDLNQPAYRSAVPGDLVKVRITKAKKSSAEAELLNILTPSPDRVKAECPYFGECGGCTLQELSYEAQKKLKREQVRAKLIRIGGIEDPRVNECIGADTLKYYRNKAVFAVGPHGEVGFMKGKSHFVMDIDDCMLQSDAAMVCADALRAFLRDRAEAGYAPDQGRKNSGGQSKSAAAPAPVISGLTVKTAFGTGEVMAVLETVIPDSRKKHGRGNSGNKAKAQAGAADPFDIPGIETLVEMLDDAVYSINPAETDNTDEEVHAAASANDNAEGSAQASDNIFYSLESVAVINNGKCRVIAGKATITEEVITDDGRSLMFEISPQSFYQVNPEQMEKLYDTAAVYADLKGGETVLDLYCGAGTIGLWLLEELRKRDAEAFGRTRVIGIESVKPAVLDANRNSVINGFVNTRYICGKAEEELPGMMGLAKLYKWNEVNERVEREPEIKLEHADVAVLDPPRAGCAEPLLAAVVQSAPDRIVYVSCDPGTLARDIRYLTQNGYEFTEATPVDQFPWTSSTEVCSILKRKES